jgi:PAS domain S-box-containing protein/diguanylate cyclase (GGDEF)-like protein
MREEASSIMSLSEPREGGLRVLLLEDVEVDAELALRQLARAGIRLSSRCVATEAAFVRELEDFDPHLVLSDFSLPGFDGLTALQLAKQLRPDLPYIFVSGTIGEERAIESIRCGATDYVLKSNLSRLPTVVDRALREVAERSARKVAEEQRRQSEEHFRLLVNGVTDYAICMLSPDGRIVSWNTGAERITGYHADEILRADFATVDRAPGEESAAVAARLHEASSTGHTATEGLRCRKDGATFWANVAITALYTETEELRGFAVVIRDVTERKTSQEKIARLSRIHAVLGDINSAIVRIRDRKALFEEACRIAVEEGKFGIGWIGQLDQTTGQVALAAIYGRDAAWLSSTSNEHVLGGPTLVGQALAAKRALYVNDLAADCMHASERRAEVVRRGYRSAVVLPLVVGDSPVGNLTLVAKEPEFFNDDELRLLNQLAADISFALEHIEKEERLNYLAFYDALTGLPNRTLFSDRIGRLSHSARSGTKRYALIVTELLRLRLINATLGRGAGDALLCEFANRLRRSWPETADLARIGPNIFAAMLSDVGDVTEIAHLLETSLERITAEPYGPPGEELQIAVASGIALFPDDAQDAESLVRNAEAALARSKQGGERYLFYEPDMNARVAKTLLLETRLRRAIEKEQFVLHYQPKVDLRTNRLVGLEALIRWNDPDNGLIPPMEFIPVLEQTGMILDVGRWAIEKAIFEYKALRARDLACPRIAVNVSAIQLRHRDFVSVIQSAVAKAGSDEHGLDLEITESLAMENVMANIPKLQALKDMGIGIAIDDFGTGYSSLAYIAKLPVDALKIDRSFIVNMTNHADDMTIISTIISLSHDLRLHVIAEGVDSEEQAKLLRLLKCDQMQGYLISKPVPIERIAADLERAGEKGVIAH